MNFYPFHVGDYAAHTRHLTMMEDLAYRRLLDAYYLGERPLNGCVSDVARSVGMVEHLEAVGYVLKTFFQHDGDQFSNKRCDAELAHYLDKKEKNSSAGKASAQRRLAKRATSVDIPSTDVQPTMNHEPVTKNHKKTEEKKTAPEGVSDSVWLDFQKLRVKQRAPVTATVMAGIQREADSAGLTLEAALQLCCERSWRGFKAEWVADKPGKAIAPTYRERDRLAGIERWEQMTGEIHPERAKKAQGMFLEVGHG